MELVVLFVTVSVWFGVFAHLENAKPVRVPRRYRRHR